MKRRWIATIALFALLLAAVVMGCTIGETPLPVGDVAASLVGRGERGTTMIVMNLRLPRMVVGAALGLSGAIIQSLAGNPLASPDVLGVTTGAGTGAVAVIVVGGDYGGASGALAAFGVPLAAIVGGIGTVVAIRLLSRGTSMHQVLLIGVGLQATLGAVTSWLLIKASIMDAGRAIVWLTGSLNSANWSDAAMVSVAIVIGVPLLAVLLHPLSALVLGDDLATGLGVRVGRERTLLLTAAVVLAATATAAAGPIAFIALGAPQVALRLLRAPTPPIFASALTGATITLWADWLGRVAFAPNHLPVGILTAGLGAPPFLVYLLITSTKADS